RQDGARPRPIHRTIRFNVYVTKEGRAVSAYVEESTLGDRDTEACMVDALRATLWPVAVEAARSASPVSRAFIAGDPMPAPPIEPAPTSGIRIRPPPGEPPPGEPDPFPIKYVGRLPLISPAFAGGLVFITILL